MLKQVLEEGRYLTDNALERLLPAADEYPSSIHQAMRHSVFAGGKRLRPILCMEAAQIVHRCVPTGVEELGAALELLRSLPVDGRRVVVTPGIVELGRRQQTENEAFAGAAARFAAALVVVGRTNEAALRRGAVEGGAQVVRVPTRERAVEWVRISLTHGDAVLYENDLPDHYP